MVFLRVISSDNGNGGVVLAITTMGRNGEERRWSGSGGVGKSDEQMDNNGTKPV